MKKSIGFLDYPQESAGTKLKGLIGIIYRLSIVCDKIDKSNKNDDLKHEFSQHPLAKWCN